MNRYIKKILELISKTTYLSVSSLTYQKCLFSLLSNYFDRIVCNPQRGFRKVFNAVNCLLPMIEKWRESSEQDRTFGAFFIDLSLSHDPTIDKLLAYGLDAAIKANVVLFKYQEINGLVTKYKIYNSWSKMLFGQGPLPFNIFVCTLFFFTSNSNILNMLMTIHFTQLERS